MITSISDSPVRQTALELADLYNEVLNKLRKQDSMAAVIIVVAACLGNIWRRL